MKVLMLYPKFPQSFWSFDKFLKVSGFKGTIPPLGLITVAALLPESWEMRFYDRNVNQESDLDWEWCDIVFISAMLAQANDFHHLIKKAAVMGKLSAVGGPYPTSIPEDAVESGAHYLVLDEGEVTVPLFLDAVDHRIRTGIFRAPNKPDMTISPIPRFDLLNRNAYLMMAMQYSRGCPFDCEFCDIINLYGRKSRTKSAGQIKNELQTIFDLGWRGTVFLVDDNFVGNRHQAKQMLRELIPWLEEKGNPFTFETEASIDLVQDPELMGLMVQAGFNAVFIGIETPDTDILKATRKPQNVRNPIVEACRTINDAGLMIQAGLILGFDGEKPGAGERINALIHEIGVPQAMPGLLQALPNTSLWDRLKMEGRLIEHAGVIKVGDQNCIMNFKPSRPVAEIAGEYLDLVRSLYSPKNYLKRCFDQCLRIASIQGKSQMLYIPFFSRVKLFLFVLWHYGVRYNVRKQFWQQLWIILRQKRKLFELYIGLCAVGGHFFEYRDIAKERIVNELGFDPITVSSTK